GDDPLMASLRTRHPGEVGVLGLDDAAAGRAYRLDLAAEALIQAGFHKEGLNRGGRRADQLANRLDAEDNFALIVATGWPRAAAVARSMRRSRSVRHPRPVGAPRRGRVLRRIEAAPSTISHSVRAPLTLAARPGGGGVRDARPQSSRPQ